MDIQNKYEELSTLKKALIAVNEMQQKIKRLKSEKNDAIAIIGMAAKFPKANNINEFWQNLLNKVDCISEVPKDRWNVDEFYDERKNIPGKMISRFGGFINDYDKFDASFFGISPREAIQMDPQQRLLLEVAWEALEDAAIKVSEISESRTGVFIGISNHDYIFVQLKNGNYDYKIIDAYQGSGNASSIAANRLSYFLNLKGPSISIDTACSSSLVTVHLACQSLISRETNLALAGGVNLILSPHASITFSQANMLSPDGKCKTFDSEANGYVRGEGVGIVVLKRYSDAINDGDDILAVIRGSAVNQDGRTNGLMAPNTFSQVEVIKSAFEKAKITPSDIGFIETFGTGTILGDPIEVQALTMLMKDRKNNLPCYLGAVKSNIGHLEAAAGIAGLIKTVLVLKNKTIPPNINFKNLNPHISIDQTQISIPSESVNWENKTSKRYASVSSFGFGGTNAHIVLEEAPEKSANSTNVEITTNLFCLSAPDDESLKNLTKKFYNYLRTEAKIELNDLVLTVNNYREKFTERVAILFNSRKELIEKLLDFSDGNHGYNIFKRNPQFGNTKKVVFMFTGQGSQYIKMAKELYDSQQVFKETLDSCINLSTKYLVKSLDEIIFNENDNSLINETEFTQTAIFAIEYSLAKFWVSLGVTPDYLIGHSIGEYAAACLSEVFTLEEGIKLTALRGKLMQSLPKDGSMVAVFSNIETVSSVINNSDNTISVAGENGPANIVISGKKKEIEKVLPFFRKNNIEFVELNVSHAFHSNLMEPILDEFEKEASVIEFKTPKYNFISNLNGELLKTEKILDAKYWRNHIRNTVKFAKGMKTLNANGCNIFIEIGSNPILIGMGRQCIPENDGLWIPSIKKNESNLATFLSSLGILFVNGFNINFKALYFGYQFQKLHLPTYAFRRERFYADTQNFGNIISTNSFDNTRTVKCQLFKDELNNNITSLKVFDDKNNLLIDLSGVDFEIKINNKTKDDDNGQAQNNPKTQNIDLNFKNKLIFDSNIFNTLDIKNKEKYISNFLIEALSEVLKLSANRIDPNKSVLHLGLDSIMAIELKNKLESKFNIIIPVHQFLKGPSIIDLAQIIINEFDSNKTKVEIPILKRKFEYNLFLSHGQNSMWFQYKLAPDSIFNPTYAVKVLAKIDIDRLGDAINKIVQRHESLRTTYSYANGKTIKIIHDNIKTPFFVHKCQKMSDSQIREMVNRFSKEPFDLEKSMVIKIHLFRIDEFENILLLCSHHIAVDFWSQAIIVNEIGKLYEGKEALPELEYSYEDFINWQNEYLKNIESDKDISFWKEKLKGELQKLDLPTVYKRKPIQTFNGSSTTITFNSELTSQLNKISNENNSTLFVVLLSSFFVLLNKYTHQEDLIIGTPFSGRSLSQFKNVVGYFVNPLPIRQKLNSHITFNELISRVKKDILETFEHQNYPFNLIVEKVHPQRDVSRTPIFQVMFVYQKAQLLAEEGLSGFAVGKQNSRMNLGGLPISNYILETQKSIFDITLTIAETGNEITASFVYNKDLFDKNYIEQFSTIYEKILLEVVKNSTIKINNLCLIDPPNTEDYDLQKSLNKLSFVHKEFEKRVYENPQKVAVNFNNKTVTYLELNKKANKLAHYLLSNKVKVETKIGVFIDRSFSMIESIIAILKSGCVYVPIDTILPAERINNIIRDAKIKYIISDKANCKKILEKDVEIVCIDEIENELTKSSNLNPDLRIDMLNLAYSIYTSGSTGIPKGVMLTHQGLSNLVKNQTEIFNITSESNILQFASLSFDASVSEIFTALVNGANLTLISKDMILSGTALISEIKAKNITVATLPPSLLSVLPYDELKTLRTLVSAGEQCTKDIVQKWCKNREFINAYGPTEVTVCATCNIISEFKNGENVAIGKSIDGVQIYILENNLNHVPKGVNGELYISGIGLARGYNNLPELTAEKFIPNPFTKLEGSRLYKTGDLVVEKNDGKIEFIGRLDDQIKFRGYRIELKEIQTILDEHDNVIKSEVILKFNKKGEKKLVAFYLSKNNIDIEKNFLRDYLSSRIPEYMVPSYYVRLNEIPLNSNGKVDRKYLEKIPLEDNSDVIIEKPSNEIENEILTIWEEILGLEQINLSDNFFDLGGHSLNLIEIQTKLKEKYDRDIEIIDLFKYPTIKLFSNFLTFGNTQSNSLDETKLRIEKQKKFISTRVKPILKDNKN